MVICAVCGQENVEKANYCRSCGATLTNETYSKSTDNMKTVMFPKPKESIGFSDRSTGEHLILRCSLCGGEDFAQDTGRIDSRWGVTSFKVVILTCKYCGHVELFNRGRSIFDFD